MKKKSLTKDVFDMLIDMFSTIFLWLLIWTGAVIALIDHGDFVLAIFLVLSGFAWLYKDAKNYKKEVKKK